MILGIDADIDKSGVAVLHQDTKRIEYSNMKFSDLIKFIQMNAEIITCVYLEAGWLNKSIHHFAKNKKMAGRIGTNVGQNHATGQLLNQVIESYGVKVVLCKPTRSKLDADQFKKVTGIQTRTNQEARDAVMLVFGR